MKKKTRATASGAAKRPKSGASGRKTAPRRTPAAEPLPAASSDDAKATIRRLKAQLAKTQARIEELQASADTDFLLDIPNRRGFERELQRAIAYIKRYRAGGALIVLDVDRLKPINDTFGHAAGDQVLKAIVATLSGQVRSSDVIGRTITDGASAGVAILDIHSEACRALEAADSAMYVRKALRRHELS